MALTQSFMSQMEKTVAAGQDEAARANALQKGLEAQAKPALDLMEKLRKLGKDKDGYRFVYNAELDMSRPGRASLTLEAKYVNDDNQVKHLGYATPGFASLAAMYRFTAKQGPGKDQYNFSAYSWASADKEGRYLIADGSDGQKLLDATLAPWVVQAIPDAIKKTGGAGQGRKQLAENGT